MHEYKSNRELLDEYDQLVKGHTQAKKAIINLVNRSKIRYYQRYKHLDTQYNLLEPHKILLIGKSGHGKTHLVETASRLMNFPLVKIDATQLTPTGNGQGISSKGLKKLITDKAKNLLNTSKYYHSEQGVIDQTVVFIDEIDKLCKPSDSTGNWNKHVQENFLTIFEDKGILAGVSFIFAGAFSGIDEDIKRDNKTSSSMGFHAKLHNKDHLNEVEWDRQVIKFGLVPELVGRIRGVYKIDDLSRDDYRDILVNILLPKKQDQLIYYHCTNFTLHDEAIEKMIDRAIESGQGVRSLKRQLDLHVADIEFYYEDVASDTLLLENMIDRYGSQSKE